MDDKRPIATILKYIRPVIPGSINPIDDEIIYNAQHLESESCITLVPDENGDYIEPITNFKVLDSSLTGCNAEEIYDYSIGRNTRLTLGYTNNEIPPYGFVTKEILQLWKETTVPYSEELIRYLEKIKQKN